MNDKCHEGFKEAVCIHTDKVYDSCRGKDCLENIRVYLTANGQSIVDRAMNVKCTKAEIIWVFSDIEAVPFNRGFYSVDLKYFFRITLAVFTGLGRPTEVEGLATFNKKVILFGSEGTAKIFASKYKEDAFDPQLWRKTNMPNAIVEVVDPIALGAKVVDIEDKCCQCCDDDFDLVVFDLYDVIIDFLEKKRFLEKCYDFEKKNGMERITKAVTNAMKINDNDSLIVQYIKEHTPENAIVFLTGIGKCYPILRSHKVLNNLHQAFVRCPVVMFFPGTYNEQELILFNEIKDDNYYRAFRLVK